MALKGFKNWVVISNPILYKDVFPRFFFLYLSKDAAVAGSV
jgi:hypothetical protein